MTRVRILLFACMFVGAVLGLCALGAALPARAAAPHQVAPPFVGVVTENANLRTGPGTTFDRVRGATAGQVVEIVGCNDACDWYQLAGGDWIAAFLVTPQAPAAAAPAANAPAPTAVSAPSSLPAAGLAPAQVVSISDGDSLLVDIGGQNLVVRYLGIDSPDGGPGRDRARQVNAKLNEGQIVYLEQGVADRDNYGRLLRFVWLADGRLLNQELVRLGCATVTVAASDLKYGDRLLRAQSAAQEAKRNCSVEDARPPAAAVAGLPALAPTPAPALVTRQAPGRDRGIVNTTANLRAGPSTQHEILGRAATGEAVQIAGCNEACDWYKLANGQWVLAELVTVPGVTTAAAPSPAPAATRAVTAAAAAPQSGERYGVVTADRLNVRAAPGTGEPVIDGLGSGACVEVLALQPQWAQVKLQTAQTGWCAREFLSFTSACPTFAPAPPSAVMNVAAAAPQPAAGCAGAGVVPNAAVAGNTYAHECFGEGDGGLRQVSAGTPVEVLGVGAFQPPGDQAAKLGGGPFFKVRIWDGQVAWLPASALNVDPAGYPQVSAICEACDRLQWAQVPRIRDAPTPAPAVRAPSYTPSYGGATTNANSGCCKVCTTGKACGNSCISRSYTCHKGPGCACNG